MGTRGPMPGNQESRESGRQGGHPAGVRKSSLATTPTPFATLAEIPEPPKGLQLRSRSREIWATLWESPLAAALDLRIHRVALERWISYVDRWYRIQRALEDADILLTTPQGTLTLNPLSAELHRIEGAITRLEKELGLTPMAMARLGLTTVESKLAAAQLNQMVATSGPDHDDQLTEW